MQLVTRRTRQAGRRLEAPALLEQSHLVPMNVYASPRVGFQTDVRSQRCTRLERKRRRNTAADPAVALRADVDLAIPLDSDGGHLCHRHPICLAHPIDAGGCASRVLSHMLRTRAMASLARNPKHKIRTVVVKSWPLAFNRLKICRMAFQTSRINPPIKVRRSIHVSRAIHPAIQARPI